MHGTILRLSIRLGYHLDPTSLRDITPFQAEMRRRVWTFVRTSDILLSFQISLPSMVQPRWLNGGLPKNLCDDSFGPESSELPPSQPDSETTPILFLISKARILFYFSKALNEIEQLADNILYTRILALDSELRSIYANSPPQFRLQTVPDSPGPDPVTTACGLVVGGLYHKALCVIHSKLLKSAATDQQYLYSWLSCIDSALSLLSFQSFQHEHFRVDGKVTALIHFQTSLTIHDFFLAATILCTTLFLKRGAPTTEFSSRTSVGPDREKILAALDTCVMIFEHERSESVEAFRACELLTHLLHELRRPQMFNAEDDLMPSRGSIFTAQLESTLGSPSTSSLITSPGFQSRSYNNTNDNPQIENGQQTLGDAIPPYVSDLPQLISLRPSTAGNKDGTITKTLIPTGRLGSILVRLGPRRSDILCTEPTRTR